MRVSPPLLAIWPSIVFSANDGHRPPVQLHLFLFSEIISHSCARNACQAQSLQLKTAPPPATPTRGRQHQSALSSVVEHILHTDGVAGSNPAARTILIPTRKKVAQAAGFRAVMRKRERKWERFRQDSIWSVVCPMSRLRDQPYFETGNRLLRERYRPNHTTGVDWRLPV